MRNRLFYNRVYLAGPIDNAKDLGVGWRNMITQELGNLDLIFLDPCNKMILDTKINEDLQSHLNRQALKDTGDFTTLAKEMRLIRRIDLRMVDLCDFAIVHLDLETYTSGTAEELTTLNRRKVPILIHMQQGKRMLPDWWIGAVPHQHVFGEWSELIDYVNHVAHDSVIETYNRWQFLDYRRLYGLA